MHAIFKPKRTILLTLMETSQKSFKESKKIKRELERKQTSANSIHFFFCFEPYQMWLSIHSNDGHFKISICKLNYTSIHVLLLNVYRHKIIWNYPQKQGK